MYQRQRVLAPLLVAAALTLAACTNSPSADPTNPPASSTETSAEAPPTSSEATQPTTSSTPPTSSPPAPSTSSQPTTTTSNVKPSTSSSAKLSTSTAPAPPPDERYTVSYVKGLPAANLAAAKDAALAWRGMQDTWDRSLQDPKATDWSKVMAKYMAGRAYATWQAGFKPMTEHDFHLVGYTTASAKVVNVAPDGAGKFIVDMRSCYDSTGVLMVDKKGDPIEMSEAPGRATWIIRIRKSAGDWRVDNLIQRTTAGKAIPCDD